MLSLFLHEGRVLGSLAVVGTLQVREELMSLTYDIVITTYEVIMIEKAALRKFHWRYVLMRVFECGVYFGRFEQIQGA